MNNEKKPPNASSQALKARLQQGLQQRLGKKSEELRTQGHDPSKSNNEGFDAFSPKGRSLKAREDAFFGDLNEATQNEVDLIKQTDLFSSGSDYLEQGANPDAVREDSDVFSILPPPPLTAPDFYEGSNSESNDVDELASATPTVPFAKVAEGTYPPPNQDMNEESERAPQKMQGNPVDNFTPESQLPPNRSASGSVISDNNASGNTSWNNGGNSVAAKPPIKVQPRIPAPTRPDDTYADPIFKSEPEEAPTRLANGKFKVEDFKRPIYDDFGPAVIPRRLGDDEESGSKPNQTHTNNAKVPEPEIKDVPFSTHGAVPEGLAPPGASLDVDKSAPVAHTHEGSNSDTLNSVNSKNTVSTAPSNNSNLPLNTASITAPAKAEPTSLKDKFRNFGNKSKAAEILAKSKNNKEQKVATSLPSARPTTLRTDTPVSPIEQQTTEQQTTLASKNVSEEILTPTSPLVEIPIESTHTTFTPQGPIESPDPVETDALVAQQKHIDNSTSSEPDAVDLHNVLETLEPIGTPPTLPELPQVEQQADILLSSPPPLPVHPKTEETAQTHSTQESTSGTAPSLPDDELLNEPVSLGSQEPTDNDKAVSMYPSTSSVETHDGSPLPETPEQSIDDVSEPGHVALDLNPGPILGEPSLSNIISATSTNSTQNEGPSLPESEQDLKIVNDETLLKPDDLPAVPSLAHLATTPKPSGTMLRHATKATSSSIDDENNPGRSTVSDPISSDTQPVSGSIGKIEKSQSGVNALASLRNKPDTVAIRTALKAPTVKATAETSDPRSILQTGRKKNDVNLRSPTHRGVAKPMAFDTATYSSHPELTAIEQKEQSDTAIFERQLFDALRRNDVNWIINQVDAKSFDYNPARTELFFIAALPVPDCLEAMLKTGVKLDTHGQVTAMALKKESYAALSILQKYGSKIDFETQKKIAKWRRQQVMASLAARVGTRAYELQDVTLGTRHIDNSQNNPILATPITVEEQDEPAISTPQLDSELEAFLEQSLAQLNQPAGSSLENDTSTPHQPEHPNETSDEAHLRQLELAQKEYTATQQTEDLIAKEAQEAFEAQQAQAAKEAQEALEAQQAQAAKEAQEALEAQQAQAAKEAQEALEAQQAQAAKEAQEALEAQQAQAAKEAKEALEAQQAQASKEAQEAFEAQQAQAAKEAQEALEAQQAQAAKEAQEALEAQQAQAAKEAQEALEAQQAQAAKEAQEALEAQQAQAAKEAQEALEAQQAQAAKEALEQNDFQLPDLPIATSQTPPPLVQDQPKNQSNIQDVDGDPLELFLLEQQNPNVKDRKTYPQDVNKNDKSTIDEKGLVEPIASALTQDRIDVDLNNTVVKLKDEAHIEESFLDPAPPQSITNGSELENLDSSSATLNSSTKSDLNQTPDPLLRTSVEVPAEISIQPTTQNTIPPTKDEDPMQITQKSNSGVSNGTPLGALERAKLKKYDQLVAEKQNLESRIMELEAYAEAVESLEAERQEFIDRIEQLEQVQQESNARIEELEQVLSEQEEQALAFLEQEIEKVRQEMEEKFTHAETNGGVSKQEVDRLVAVEKNLLHLITEAEEREIQYQQQIETQSKKIDELEHRPPPLQEVSDYLLASEQDLVYRKHIFVEHVMRGEVKTLDKIVLNTNIDKREASYALCFAAEAGQIRAADWIMKYMDADIHVADELPLLRALEHKQIPMVQWLITHGANFHHADEFALRFAVRKNNILLLDYLVARGASVHAGSGRVLMEAFEHQSWDAFRSLLAYGAKATDDNGQTLKIFMDSQDALELISWVSDQKEALKGLDPEFVVRHTGKRNSTQE